MPINNVNEYTIDVVTYRILMRKLLLIVHRTNCGEDVGKVSR